jgi:hypothetical protein
VTTYRWTNQGFVERESGRPMQLPPFRSVLPRIVGDIEPYESPASGKWITSRSQQRDDLAATGSRLVEPSESPTGMKLRNRRFAEKHGLLHMMADDARDYDASHERTMRHEQEAKQDG